MGGWTLTPAYVYDNPNYFSRNSGAYPTLDYVVEEHGLQVQGDGPA